MTIHVCDRVEKQLVEGRMKNPYIGKEGRYYDSAEALERANKEFNERMNVKKRGLK